MPGGGRVCLPPEPSVCLLNCEPLFQKWQAFRSQPIRLATVPRALFIRGTIEHTQKSNWKLLVSCHKWTFSRGGGFSFWFSQRERLAGVLSLPVGGRSPVLSAWSVAFGRERLVGCLLTERKQTIGWPRCGGRRLNEATRLFPFTSRLLFVCPPGLS